LQGCPAVLHQGTDNEKGQDQQGGQTDFPVQRQPLRYAQPAVNR